MKLSLARAAVTTSQLLTLSATTNDTAGVNWSLSPSASGGSFSPATSMNGASVTLAAPTAAGTYTVTATSVTDPTQSASMTLFVSDLKGVYTYHDDLSRDGANTHEYALSPQNVNTTTFGKLFSCQVDGAIYAQPLWVAGVKLADGSTHNVIYVATQHDSLYAFDADASPCSKLWSVSLIDAAHGGSTGETSVPETSTLASPAAGTPAPLAPLVGGPDAAGDQAPEVGVTGTPVIDPASGTLYVVSKSVLCSPSPCTISAQNKFYQRLHAIDLATGNEKVTPATIAATYPGTGDSTTGHSTTTVTFSAQLQNQRPGLALVNGTVYVAWSSHEDAGHYYGWIMGYNAATLQQSYVLNITPDVQDPSGNGGHGGGIWMGGGAPAADANNNLYLITGDAPFDANSTQTPHDDYGDSILKLAAGSGALTVADYFTPDDELTDDSTDADFGSGGAAVVVNLPAGLPVSQLLIGGGEGSTPGQSSYLYVLNTSKLGGLESSANTPWQKIPVADPLNEDNGGVIYSTPAFWNNTLYVGPGAGQPLMAYTLNTSSGLFNTTPLQATSPQGGYGFPGTTPSISASGTSNGIVWTLDNSQYCLPEHTANTTEICGAAVLHAYDAANFASGKITELWNSSMVGSDAAGHAVKFTVPTVANGKVYVGTQGTNIGWVDPSTVAGELDVYGLKPN